MTALTAPPHIVCSPAVRLLLCCQGGDAGSVTAEPEPYTASPLHSSPVLCTQGWMPGNSQKQNSDIFYAFQQNTLFGALAWVQMTGMDWGSPCEMLISVDKLPRWILCSWWHQQACLQEERARRSGQGSKHACVGSANAPSEWSTHNCLTHIHHILQQMYISPLFL